MTHSFDVATAKAYGLNAAIVLDLLQRWIAHNRANKKNEREGRTWTYNSMKAWTELLPYLTEKQVRTAVDVLVAAGLVVKANFNEHGYDRTLWYAVADEAICPVGRMEAPPGETPSAAEGESSISGKNQLEEPPSGGKKTKEDEVTLESIAFVEAFLKLLANTGAKITPPTTAARVKWADTYEKLVRIDGKTKGEIWRVCVWARSDNFWKGNFFSPVKLRLSGDDGIRYYDKFSAKMASSNGNSPNGKHHSRGFSGGNVSAYAELDLKLAAQP